jgi:HSP20 family protein
MHHTLHERDIARNVGSDRETHIGEGETVSKLMRWTPNGDWMGVHDEVSRLFDSLVGTAAPGTQWAPAVDVRETGEEFFVRLDLPGLEAKDVKVSVFEDTLTVSGERRESTESKDMRWHHVERYHGTFERRFQLGKAVQGDKVSATYKNGVLEIRVPKAEQAKPRDIQIQISGS